MEEADRYHRGMTPFPFDAVLFERDGVLVDSEPITNRVLAEMPTELGWPLTPEESLHVFLGRPSRTRRR
jgi:beta-phosphoglucomutase-like phosphatase (HAD superfamily)